MNAFNKKVLVIGLDGASWELFDELINLNFMPYLKKIKDEGAFGPVLSTIPPISPAAWGTIQTGKNALRNHTYEFYCFNQLKRKIEIVNSSFLKNTIWEILSKVGKRVGVVNVPMTYPPKKVNGYIVSGILTPSLDSNFTYPLDLREEILKKIPDYQLHYSEDLRYGNPHYDLENFILQRIKNIKDRTKVCVKLINDFKVDIFMVNLQANDILQHVLWGYMDKNHELYNEKIKHYIFTHFHKTLDSCIKVIREEFIRNSHGEVLTIVLSDHGCESHDKKFFLGDWLYQNNFLKLNMNVIKSVFRRKFKELILKFKISNFNIKLLNLFKNYEKKLTKNGKFQQETNFLKNIIDWEHSYAISMGISLYGLIFILKQGRKRERIIQQLKKELFSIKDSETGEKIVDKIYIKEEIYNGNKPELIPDLIIKPKKGYSFTGQFQNRSKLFQKVDKLRDFAIGKHSEEGILIINGQNVVNKIIDNASLRDIMPTILNYFQLPKIDDLDGKVLDCFK